MIGKSYYFQRLRDVSIVFDEGNHLWSLETLPKNLALSRNRKEIRPKIGSLIGQTEFDA
jgi:hypothetical protein